MAHKELRRLWRQIPTKIGKPQPSSVMRPWTTPISTVNLCIDPNPNRFIPQVASGSCSVRVCNLQLDDSQSIPSVPLIWGNDSQIVLPNYRQVILLPSYYSTTYSHASFPAKHHPLASCFLDVQYIPLGLVGWWLDSCQHQRWPGWVVWYGCHVWLCHKES